MTLKQLAYKHQQARVALSRRVARRAAQLWRGISAGNLDTGWDRIAPLLTAEVWDAQLTAARQATPYVNAALRAQGLDAPSSPLEVEAFGGVTLEGREIAPELYSAVTQTKSLIGRGVGVGAAFQAGTALMSVLAATMVRDAGNMADKVATVGKQYTYMARMVQPGACSRCAILAGVGAFYEHFERHPGCRCTTVPVARDDRLPDGLFSSPEEYFESLTKAEQDRVFTKAGAEAIRLGADPISVVNARRGMFRTQQPKSLVARAQRSAVVTPTGRTFEAYTTVEGTSRRGAFGRGLLGARPGDLRLPDANRKTRAVRLMPETIIDLANGDVEKARTLLRQYGYLIR